jgi:hypothetical protein
MDPVIQAAAVLVPEPGAPRRHKDTDQHFSVRFRVLPDDEALSRLSGLQGDPAPDPEDGARYEASGSNGGMGLYGSLEQLHGAHLHRGDFVKMEIRAFRSEARIRCLGLVSWVRVNRTAGLFRAGVGFVGVDRRDLKEN